MTVFCTIWCDELYQLSCEMRCTDDKDDTPLKSEMNIGSLCERVNTRSAPQCADWMRAHSGLRYWYELLDCVACLFQMLDVWRHRRGCTVCRELPLFENAWHKSLITPVFQIMWLVINQINNLGPEMTKQYVVGESSVLFSTHHVSGRRWFRFT
jgi:hypothetical protein